MIICLIMMSMVFVFIPDVGGLMFFFSENPNINKWSDIEIRALRCLYNNKVPLHDISFLLCRPYGGVKFQIRKHFLSNRYKPYTEHDINVIKKYAGKKSISFIASLINHSSGSVRQYAYRNGISLFRYGDNLFNTKYSDNDVLLMRALYDEGLRVCDIAVKFELTLQMVSYCLFRRHISSDYYLKSEVKRSRKAIKAYRNMRTR